MTRLIDADALKYEPLPKGERNYRTYNLDDAYEDGYDDAFVDVRNAPTIDAIPIEWLIRMRNEHNNDGFAWIYEAVMDDWRKEHAETD